LNLGDMQDQMEAAESGGDGEKRGFKWGTQRVIYIGVRGWSS